MLVKGYLVEDWNTFKHGTEVRVDVPEKELMEKGWYNHECSPEVSPEKVNEIQQDYLRELLEATIKHVVCPEYLELFEDVDEWQEYKRQLLSEPDALFTDFVKGDIQDMLEEKSDEVYQNNKPKYYPVDVQIYCNATIYVKARSEEEVHEFMGHFDAEEVIDDCGSAEYEFRDFWINDAVDDDYARYETTYDAEDYI